MRLKEVSKRSEWESEDLYAMHVCHIDTQDASMQWDYAGLRHNDGLGHGTPVHHRLPDSMSISVQIRRHCKYSSL